MVQNHCVLEFMEGLDIQYYFVPKNMMLFMIKLDILLVKKSGITHILSHNFAKAKNFSFNTLPLEKSLNLDNIILIKFEILNELMLIKQVNQRV